MKSKKRERGIKARAKFVVRVLYTLWLNDDDGSGGDGADGHGIEDYMVKVYMAGYRRGRNESKR
jgi:hypothetical protein